jgi:hypothetical protein
MAWGWYYTIYEIATTGVLGNIKEVERTNLWDFLNALSIKRSADKIG